MSGPNVTVGARAGGRAAVTQAKVTRAATGEVEYHYSITKVPWWNLKQRRWVKTRLEAFKRQEHT